MRHLEFRIISESEADHFERTPHNPPSYSKAFTEEDFSKEWWAVRDALKERLELLGEEWQAATDTGDFVLQESYSDSRWIYITFRSTHLWRPEFVYAAADVLAGLPHDYRVGCLTELRAEEIFDYPLVYLVISSATVFGTVDDPSGGMLGESSDVLGKFGFPIRSRSE